MSGGLNTIFDRLGLDQSNGLFITSDKNSWKELFSKRIEEFFESIYKPDAFFCIDNKPFILFYDNPSDEKTIFKSVWCFNESPIVIINKVNVIEIYNGFSYIKKNQSLGKIGNDEKLNDFEYLKLVTGKSWEKIENKLGYKNRVDFNLLENIKSAREMIIKKSQIKNSLANNLIGKCIFVRYLIDRNVRIGFNGESKEWSDNDFYEILKDFDKTKAFFNYLKDKFNGNLFPINEDEYPLINKDVLNILIHLLKGSDIQSDYFFPTLFDVYDFSIIPVEFISNVYELFIGQNEQAKKGAYYTPVFLVEYILSQTVEKYFIENPNEYNCRVLDPACGSGIFLVETLRKIIKRFETLHPEISKSSNQYKNTLIKLVKDNIFGIDKDPDAINVASFSIYLTMLHYQSPRDIENFVFPVLENSNFFIGDFFDLETDYNNRLNEISFNFIIGNPPWKRGKGQKEKTLYNLYISERKQNEKKYLKNNEPEIEISNEEIAQAFLLRTSDFSKENTKCALIATSKVLYNLNGVGFRRYFLDRYFIDKVFELAAVRKEVFNRSNDPSIAPAAVLFYHYAHGINTDSNVLEHIALKPNRFFSLFNIFSIQRNDYKKVSQKKLKDYDYLWKVLVYGSYLDFNLIKRLKADNKNFLSVIHECNMIRGEGMIIGKNGDYESSDYIGKIFIDTKKKHLSKFHIQLDSNSIFNIKKVHRKRNDALFIPPCLLISRGVDNILQPKAAILYSKAVFTHSLTSIKTTNINLNILKNANGIICSNFFSYYILQTGSSICIEREQIHDEEKINFPYIENENISNYVTKIEKLNLDIHEKKKEFIPVFMGDIYDIQQELELSLYQLNNEILKSFNIDEQEKSLIDYAVNITIPLIMRHKKYKNIFMPIEKDSLIITDYANVFIDRFADTFNKIGLDFKIEVWYNENILGIFFKQTPKNDNNLKNLIIYNDSQTDEILKKISSFGIEKITDKLFIQKDIRGFEENGFYIIKPNEKCLWHKAIAYLDMYEFADAMLKAGRGDADVQ